MDIELPNGVVIQGIPEGMTKSQVMTQAIRNGLATPEDFGFKSQPTEQPQPAQQPSMTQELGRQAGLFGRAAYEGLTAPATVTLEGLRSAYNLGANIVGSPSRLPSVAQAQSQMLTKAGLPEPRGMLERAVQTGTQAMMGTGTVAALAPKVPALSANLAQQIPASGMAGLAAQPVAEMTKEATVGVLGETGSDFAATIAAMGVGAKVGAKTADIAGMATGGKAPKLYTMDEVRQNATRSYNAMEQAGVYIKPKSVLGMVDDIEANLNSNQYIPQNDPKVANTLSKMRDIVGNRFVSFPKLEELRKMANNLRSDTDPNTRRLGNVMIGSVDEYITKLNGSDVFASTGKLDEAVKSVMSARKDWRNQGRAEVLQDALDVVNAKLADPKASESELIRRGFINIAASKNKMNLFSDSEQNVIKSVAKGGSLDPILSFVGQFSPFRAKLVTGATIGAVFGSAPSSSNYPGQQGMYGGGGAGSAATTANTRGGSCGISGAIGGAYASGNRGGGGASWGDGGAGGVAAAANTGGGGGGTAAGGSGYCLVQWWE